jgi:regulatory protein
MKDKEFEKIYNYAVKLLEIRDRTENELKEKLIEKGYDVKKIDEVLKNLKNYSFINDEKFVVNYIENQIKKCKNLKLIIEELKNKFKVDCKLLNNINFEDIRKQLIENVVKLIKKKYSLHNLQKIQNFLLSKGFDFSEIEEILNLLEGEKGEKQR